MSTLGWTTGARLVPCTRSTAWTVAHTSRRSRRGCTRQAKSWPGKVQDLPLGQQDLTRRQLDEVEFTSMEAGSIIKQFVKYWDKRLCRVQSVTSTELSSVLMDMIDDHRPQSGSASASASAAAGVGRSVSAPRTPPRPQASAAGAGSSPAPRTPPRAMAASATPKRSPERRGYMAVAEKGDAAGHTAQEAHVTLSEGTGQDSFVEPSLPLVDPLEDNTSIYVMLDEGCNTTCHGKGWRLHAERILANHGMQLLQVSQTSGTFKGVGASKTTGKWRVPFALQMEPTGALLHGDLESAELDSNDVPCLLSLTDQVQLGFVKNLRSGTVTLEDFPGQQLPLARHARTGLLLMRISCFGNVPHRLHAPFCKGELRSPLASRPGVVVKDPQLAYMVDDTEVTTSQPAVPKCKKVRFFTFGLERLEQAPGSTRNSYGLTNLFKTFRQKGKSFEFNLADPKHEDILLDCLRANFPQLLENIPDKRIIFLDCRATRDPAIDKSTRDHVGWFPFNLENMVRQEQWTKWWKEIHETFHRAIHEEEEIYVFTFCKSGRHRSLANQRLLQFVVEDYGVPRWDLNHLNQFGRHNCGGGCADCRWEAPGAREKAMVCVDLARKLWREYTKELQASKAGEASAPSGAGAASDPSGGTSTAPSAPSAPVQAEPRPAAEPTRPAEPATGPEAEAAGQRSKHRPRESKPMPRPYAKPTPKVKAKAAEAKPAEVKREPDSAREPPRRRPRLTSLGAQAPGRATTCPTSRLRLPTTSPRSSTASTRRTSCRRWSTCSSPVFTRFRPKKLPQVGELLAKYDLNLKTLVGAVAAKYLTKDSAQGPGPWCHQRRRHGARLEHGA